jgi:hypothetical protein
MYVLVSVLMMDVILDDGKVGSRHSMQLGSLLPDHRGYDVYFNDWRSDR